MDRYLELLAANTSAYGGYDLNVALEHIASLGYKRVEIAAIYGLTEHISQEQLTSKEALKVKTIMNQNGLKNTAFSAHLFLNRPDAVELFLPRMDFAKEIGASIINTKAGAPSGLDQFLRNMEQLIRHAEKIDIIIGLETHGDIVDYGKSAVEAVQRFRTDRVILNYDFGNVLINSRGKVDPAADFESITDQVGHLHLKDAVKENNRWRWTSIGQGTIDYQGIFAGIKRLPNPLPLTVDLPLSIVLNDNAEAKPVQDLLSLAEIDAIMKDSFQYIKSNLS
ncbi:MAG: sugar phosphate isomerase/epimerase family protein [Bacteroidota bacterium]